MGYVTVVTPPGPLVALEEAKAHLRLDGEMEDTYVTSLVAAAQAHIDGPSGCLKRAVAEQGLCLTLDGCELWPGASVDLPFPPFRALSSFVYDNDDGAQQSFPVEDVVVTRFGVSARLLPKYGAAWPRPRRSPDAVRITWQAGYEAGDPAAKPLKQAVLLLVGHWFQNREAVIVGQTAIEIPFAVSALLSPYRIWGA